MHKKKKLKSMGVYHVNTVFAQKYDFEQYYRNYYESWTLTTVKLFFL